MWWGLRLAPQANVAYRIIFNNVGIWLGFALRKRGWEVKSPPELVSSAKKHTGLSSLLGLANIRVRMGFKSYSAVPAVAGKASSFPYFQRLLDSRGGGKALTILFGNMWHLLSNSCWERKVKNLKSLSLHFAVFACLIIAVGTCFRIL